jgi:hypothetical protein
MGIAGVLAAMLASRTVAAERTHYECTLKGVLSGDRDVVLVVAAEQGQIRESAAMVAGQPRTAQYLKDPNLSVEAGRLRGSIVISLPPATERIDLDADLLKGGTYKIHYGCPDPPRAAEGGVTVQLPKPPDEKRTFLVLTDAMGKDSPLRLVLDLDRAARTMKGLFCWTSNYNSSSHKFDLSGLSFDGTRFEGEVPITVLADRMTPAHGQPMDALLKVKASLETLDGTYSAVFGIDRTREGELAVKAVSDGAMRDMHRHIARWVEYVVPWRAYCVVGAPVISDAGGLVLPGARGGKPVFDPAATDAPGFSRLPPADWMNADFDDPCWARYLKDDLTDYLGGYGLRMERTAGLALVCLRTAFGVSDPARVKDLRAAVRCVGGAVVYVNGREAGRGFLPQGPVHPLTPAEAYPVEAYTAGDGTTRLPDLPPRAEPDAGLLARYQARIRQVTIDIPGSLLVRGRNVLAVAIHRAAVPVAMAGARWVPMGFGDVTLESDSGAGMVPYADVLAGTRVWSANPEDQVTAAPGLRITVGGQSRSIRGILCGNPFDPVLPIRMAAPRNGVCSGQTVVTDLAGLTGLSAKIGLLKGPQGEIPAGAVGLRYAHQHGRWHCCDALRLAPEDGAKTVPVWVIVEVPTDQAPGWYTASLAIAANGKDFAVPVQVLVTGATVPDARDFTSLIGIANSPESIAAHYKVPVWSEEHLRLVEPSLRMAGQLGNDVLRVPVILGGMQPPARDWMTAGSAGARCAPLVRWVRNGERLAPDFSLLERYLDLYLKHCAPPKALSLYVWDCGCSPAVADAYEGRRIDSRTVNLKTPLLVTLWDPATGATSDLPAPQFGEPGGKEFWMPLFDGIRAIVRRRGWSERIIMASMGGDMRPSKETGELLRQWVPYLRWNFLSHFSGDPGPKDGKLIATGGLEIGLKEHPWRMHYHAYTARELEADMDAGRDFLDLPAARWHWGNDSPPIMFRNLPLVWGTVGHLGLDFWGGKGVPGNTSFFTHSNSMTVSGPDGAEPTVRFQMLREGVQETELRRMIVEAYLKLPEDRRQPYRALLDEVSRRLGWSWFAGYLSQHELGYDWRAYAAQVQASAADLAGVKVAADWTVPPPAASAPKTAARNEN